MLKIVMKKETRNLLWLMVIVFIIAECFALLYLDAITTCIFAGMAALSLCGSLYCYNKQNPHSRKI